MLRRRTLLKSAAAAGAWCATGRAGIEHYMGPGVFDAQAVQFRPEVEPLVKWLEELPRERLVEGMLGKIRDGVSYRDLLSATFLAAIRNIKPRPVGFKFHAVMALNSAHVVAQTLPRLESWLPLFWAADNFKGAQARDVAEGDWTLARVDEAHVPKPEHARAALVSALEDWDSDKADVATAGLCRSAGAAEVMEVFWRYGLRDQRNIGHKPIFTMQCWRTLQTIGWQHAEPVLRSLAFGLLDTQGDNAREPVGPYRSNLRRVRELPVGWTRGAVDDQATKALIESLRRDDSERCAEAAASMLGSGIDPACLWDAIMLVASELLVRAPGIVSLHAATAANALHFTYESSGDLETRGLALLQAAGWMPLYRQRADVKNDVLLDGIGEGESVPDVDGCFELVASNRLRATEAAIAALGAGADLRRFHARAQRLIMLKGDDSHQYKYGVAALEESILARSPEIARRISAASLAYLPSPADADQRVIAQAMQGLKGATRS